MSSATTTLTDTEPYVRYDWFSQNLFGSLDEVQLGATAWLWTYNKERPNMALGGITPRQNNPSLFNRFYSRLLLKMGGLPIHIRYIQPRKPNQNAFIERFNCTYRNEVLDAHLFDNIRQVQAITEQWLYEYNETRPHESLGNIPLTHFMPRLTTTPNLYHGLST